VRADKHANVKQLTSASSLQGIENGQTLCWDHVIKGAPPGRRLAPIRRASLRFPVSLVLVGSDGMERGPRVFPDL
jgi:hypothetical protein